MRRLFLLACVLLGTCLSAASAQAQSQFGRYLGVLKHSQIAQDQLAKLDFVVARQSASELKLIAILSLYFGDYDSNEYVSYHFDSVTYHVLTGALVFDQPDQEVSLVATRLANGRFEGQLRTVSSGNVGLLDLTQSSSVLAERPLVQPLWGEYRGICDGAATKIQVQTQRSSDDSSWMGNPFGTYEISAQRAAIEPGYCGDDNFCVTQVYDTGSYNFFRGKLDLLGRSRNLSCTVGATGLSCDGCSLTRLSNEAATSGSKSYPRFQGGFNEVPQPGSDHPATPESPEATLSGAYYGYLFHERLGVYQPVSLNLMTYQGRGVGGNPALFVSATSAMYFGDFNSQESVTSRFNEKEFPLLSPQIVLERMSGDVDSIIQLTQLGNGTARGIWYSILFGRVGTFELSNVSQPLPPADGEVMAPISGRYQGGDWALDLRVVREATPVNTVNPFFPLNFKGSFRLLDITTNIKIVGGAFDFYTGKLGMRLEDETLFSGFRSSNDSLSLQRPTPGIIRPLLPHRFQSFVKTEP